MKVFVIEVINVDDVYFDVEFSELQVKLFYEIIGLVSLFFIDDYNKDFLNKEIFIFFVEEIVQCCVYFKINVFFVLVWILDVI